MPFVRYRTGDLAVLTESGHPGLPGYSVCDRILGRVQEFVVCRDHRVVSITTLGVAHFAELADVDAIQYEQRKPGELGLKVAAEKPLGASVLARIATAVERKTQGGCDVSVEQVPHIARTPRGKARLIVQHLDVRQYFGAAAVA
jgi:phenylacetate-CoA ligase